MGRAPKNLYFYISRYKSKRTITRTFNEVSFTKCPTSNTCTLSRYTHVLIIFYNQNAIVISKVAVGICFRGKRVYEEPRYMTVGQASRQIMEAIKARKDQKNPLKRERGMLV